MAAFTFSTPRKAWHEYCERVGNLTAQRAGRPACLRACVPSARDSLGARRQAVRGKRECLCHQHTTVPAPAKEGNFTPSVFGSYEPKTWDFHPYRHLSLPQPGHCFVWSGLVLVLAAVPGHKVGNNLLWFWPILARKV